MAAFLLTASCSWDGAEGTGGARLEGSIQELLAFSHLFWRAMGHKCKRSHTSKVGD